MTFTPCREPSAQGLGFLRGPLETERLDPFAGAAATHPQSYRPVGDRLGEVSDARQGDRSEDLEFDHVDGGAFPDTPRDLAALPVPSIQDRPQRLMITSFRTENR